MANQIKVKRAYDAASSDDGARILVDRLWPRGLSKDHAQLTLWDKAVAPSNELRKWYEHDPAKFDEFVARYKSELASPEAAEAYAELQKVAQKGTLTLLTASKAVEISDASVLKSLLTDGWFPSPVSQ